jgi:competence protein ComEC
MKKKESADQIINSYLIKNSAIITSNKKNKNMLFFKGNKIFILDSSCIYRKDIQPDLLILTQSPKINLERLLQDLHPKIIIADASNTYAIQKYWEKSCSKKNIK